MAYPGFSGSNGGISEQYRSLLLADIDAGIKKYETWLSVVGKDLTKRGVKPLYELALKELNVLHTKVKEANLEKIVR